MSGPMGEMEIVYKLKIDNGKITGTQSLPFGDSPIVDGKVTGDSFHFTVALESFGDIQKKEVTGKIAGDTLILTPAMPGPPPGGGPGGPEVGSPPGGARGPTTRRSSAIRRCRGTAAVPHRPGHCEARHSDAYESSPFR